MTDEVEVKPTCFVIQSFDGGKYDRRYRETICPALEKANVEPKRADEILGLNPVIEKIETAIKSASICVAEVSQDNPNVWLELGYALALDRPTVILCDKSEREKLPFDVQHRPIVLYRSDSRSGFEELERNIIKWVTNELKSEKRISQAPVLKPGSKASDLEDYEVAILSTSFSFWHTTIGGISYYDLEKKMNGLGFSEVALPLGVSGLIDGGLLSEKLVTEGDGGFEEYEVKYYSVTKPGIEWLQRNKDLLDIREKSVPNQSPEFDDDIPF